MTVHPFIRREPQQTQTQSADPYQAGSEQWWVEEGDRSRPSPVAFGIAVLIGLVLWFVIGCLAVWVFGW